MSGETAAAETALKVALLSYTPDPEKAVARAARLCYSDKSISELDQDMTAAEAAKMVRMLYSLGHLSPFEHVSFQFGVEGVSRVLTHQLVRHRLASYSQKSQRYVSERGFEFIIPPSVAAVPEAAARFRQVMGQLREAYAELAAAGIPKEDARFVLPNACETKIMVSMNARSLLHFFELRCCERAQWEIRRLANAMLIEVRRVAPTIFARAGSPCVSLGICREGKMSCGRINRVKFPGTIHIAKGGADAGQAGTKSNE